MSNPYIGEIRMFAGNFAPNGWQFCNGALLSISDYDTLFNLIGTTYGGDGQNTFAVPDLQGRVPVHMGGGSYPFGSNGGTESVTLNSTQLPVHNHFFGASTGAPTTTSPGGALLASSQSVPVFNAGAPVAVMANTVNVQGGNQPHDNMMPFLAINFIISLFGIYPSQS